MQLAINSVHSSLSSQMIAKDSNVIVVALAGKCLTNLAKGLPQKFGQYASSVGYSVVWVCQIISTLALTVRSGYFGKVQGKEN